jgi:DNA-binding response OmpR family regulator
LDWPGVTTPWTICEKNMAQPARVLIVEDEGNIRELVALHLRHEGYVCEVASDGAAGLQMAERDHFDLMIFDVMLPGLDGLSLCRAVRNGQKNREVPILMLTARGGEADKVVGLESGADDYLTKPFGVRELVARARALLRRVRSAGDTASAMPAGSVLIVHGVEIDVARRRVRAQGEEAPTPASSSAARRCLAGSGAAIRLSRYAVSTPW